MRETVFLNTDREMPLLGLGVYKTADNEAETAITAAVNAGYRLIDTASAYKNEESVGKAIAKCGVPRKELFITSKIWNNAQRLGDVDGAFLQKHGAVEAGLSGSLSDSLAGAWLLYRNLAGDGQTS